MIMLTIYDYSRFRGCCSPLLHGLPGGTQLDLHKQLAAATGEHERTLLQRQIEATDWQIDALVYELYGLTEEEIRIVEAAAK